MKRFVCSVLAIGVLASCNGLWAASLCAGSTKPIIKVTAFVLCTDVTPTPLPGNKLPQGFFPRRQPIAVNNGGQCIPDAVYGYRTEADVRSAVNMLNRVFVDLCFELDKFGVSKNDATGYFVKYGDADKQVKAAAQNQVGSWSELRLFVVAHLIKNDSGHVTALKGYSSGGAMGVCRAGNPWNCDHERDGVTVAATWLTTITVAHEVGHWLGLYHTFEPDCAEGLYGDHVDDTAGEPADEEKNNGGPGCPNVLKLRTCTKTERTPIAGRIDAPAPVYNMMEYNDCRGEFVTPGQYDRMMKRIKVRQNLAVSDPFPSIPD